jgi:uncharacterized membrane protein YwaF
MMAPQSQPAREFVLFGAPHLTALGLSLLIALTLAFWIRRRRWRGGGGAERATCGMLGTFLIGSATFSNLYWLATGKWDIRWSVPLQLCDMAMLLSAVLLLRIAMKGRPVSTLDPVANKPVRSPAPALREAAATQRPGWRPSWQFAYELIYFWTIGGTGQAMLTPDLNHTFPHPEAIRFFTGHGGALAAMLLLTIGLGLRPRAGSVLRVWPFTNSLVPPVMLFDWATGSNYMFVMGPPANPSLIDCMGPWPWMLLSLSATALVMMTLLYAPFWWMDRRRARCDIPAPPSR